MKPERLLQAINDRRTRNPTGDGTRARIALIELEMLWDDEAARKHVPKEYFILRLFTIFEVISRDWIRTLLDARPNLIIRTAKLLERGNVKIDATLANAIQGKQITLGELVARTVPLSELAQCDALLSELFGMPLKERCLQTRQDRIPPHEIASHSTKSAEEYTASLNETWKTVQTICDQRHVIAHELPHQKRFTPIEPKKALAGLSEFVEAVETVIEIEINGKIAWTTVEMHQRATTAYQAAEKTETELFDEIVDQTNPDDQHHDYLEEARRSWMRYRDACANLMSDTWRGGSGAGIVGLSAATELTNEFVAFLKRYRRQVQGDLDV